MQASCFLVKHLSLTHDIWIYHDKNTSNKQQQLCGRSTQAPVSWPIALCLLICLPSLIQSTLYFLFFQRLITLAFIVSWLINFLLCMCGRYQHFRYLFFSVHLLFMGLNCQGTPGVLDSQWAHVDNGESRTKNSTRTLGTQSLGAAWKRSFSELVFLLLLETKQSSADHGTHVTE